MNSKSVAHFFIQIVAIFTTTIGTCGAEPPVHEHSQHSVTNAVVNPHGGENQSVEETLAHQPPQPQGLYPQKGWPMPVMDDMRHFFFLADLLEVQPDGDDSEARWDIESYYGGDFNRIWFKSEGEKSLSKDDYGFDAQLLYGRFVRKYYDLQIGFRAETTDFPGKNRTRGHAVIGLEGLIPYKFEIEPLLFISHEGDVSARFTGSRDLLITQKLVLQGRVETSVAVQKVEEFGVGSGFNNVELGLRLRYEFKRELAPYFGVSWQKSFAQTADLLRARGDDTDEIRFVTGLRIWF